MTWDMGRLTRYGDVTYKYDPTGHFVLSTLIVGAIIGLELQSISIIKMMDKYLMVV